MKANASSARTILLTGASGVIGHALLPELTRHRVVCLVHRAPVDGRESVVGDVAQERLGLAPDEYRRLAREVDCVIHSAAITDWAAPKERLVEVNVGGTRNVLAFARDAGAPFYWLSTSFIRAVAEDANAPIDEANVIVNYVRSKAEAEELVAAASDVPSTILRPTNLIGDSQTGEIAATQAPQLISDLICRGKLPLFPARPEVRVDVVPQDVVARVVAAAVDADDVGSRYWITGGEEALSVPETLDICASFMERLGRPIERPRVVHPDEIDDSTVAELSPMSRMFFGRVLELSEGQHACGIFPSSMDELRGRYELPDFTWASAFEHGLEFWARSKGLLDPSAAASG